MSNFCFFGLILLSSSLIASIPSSISLPFFFSSSSFPLLFLSQLLNPEATLQPFFSVAPRITAFKVFSPSVCGGIFCASPKHHRALCYSHTFSSSLGLTLLNILVYSHPSIEYPSKCLPNTITRAAVTMVCKLLLPQQSNSIISGKHN